MIPRNETSASSTFQEGIQIPPTWIDPEIDPEDNFEPALTLYQSPLVLPEPDLMPDSLYKDSWAEASSNYHSERTDNEQGFNASEDIDSLMLPLDPEVGNTSYEDHHSIATRYSSLDHNISNVYEDVLYNPELEMSTSTAQTQPVSTQGGFISRLRTTFSERLEAAKNDHLNARSHSPSNNHSRSPFRPGSAYTSKSYTAAEIKKGPQEEGNASVVAEQRYHDETDTPKAMGPRDALLEDWRIIQ